MDEWERYRYEQARAWLEHVAGLRHAMDAAGSVREVFESLLDSVKGIDYSRERVSGGQYENRIAEAIAKLDEARLQWGASVSAYADEASDAAARIGGLEDAQEGRALLLHYVDGKTWELVRSEMGYSWRGMMDLRKRAVLHAYDHMPASWRDPVHRAV